jgi:DNA invertase Pin-like site-specific DNA recombinase
LTRLGPPWRKVVNDYSLVFIKIVLDNWPKICLTILIGRGYSSKTGRKILETQVKAIGYIRTSSDARDRKTLDTQRKKVRDRCKNRHWTLIDTQVDNAYSGADNNRPGFNKALKALENGEAQVLVMEDLSRFSRDMAYGISVFYKMKTWGARVSLIEGDIPDDELAGPIVLSALLVMAEYNLKIQRKKSIDNRQALFDEGRPPSAPYYFGYKKGDGGYLTIDKGQAKTVKEVFKLFNGGMSQTEIANKLDMHQPLIGDILRQGPRVKKDKKTKETREAQGSEVYWTGQYELYFQGRTKFVEVPKILTKREFEKAQRILKSKANQRLPREEGYNFLLRQKIYCQTCGENYTSRNVTSRGRVYPYYIPSDACTCEKDFKRFPAQKFEDRLWGEIENLTREPGRLEQEIKNNLENIEAQVKGIDRDIEGLKKERLEVEGQSEILVNNLSKAKNERVEGRLITKINSLDKDITKIDFKIRSREKTKEALEIRSGLQFGKCSEDYIKALRKKVDSGDREKVFNELFTSRSLAVNPDTEETKGASIIGEMQFSMSNDTK